VNTIAKNIGNNSRYCNPSLGSGLRNRIESAEKLVKNHGLNVIGTIRKPMSRDKLDALVAKVSHKVTKSPVYGPPKVNE